MSQAIVSSKPPSNQQVQFFSSSRAITTLRNRWCCRLSSSSKRLIDLFQDIPGLTPFQKHTVLSRYISMTETFKRRTKLYACVFHIGRFIVTVGSLIVPALMSIQYADTGPVSVQNMSYQIYWVTWIISLLVTTCNGVLTLFKVDKKYYFLNTVLEQMQSEMWQYIYLSGKYGGHYLKDKAKPQTPTHENQYVFLCHNLEKLKLKQVEEEYYKVQDNEKKTDEKQAEQGGTADKTIAGMFSPTPSQMQLNAHQQELAKAIVQISSNLVDGAGNKAQTQTQTQTHSQTKTATTNPLSV